MELFKRDHLISMVAAPIIWASHFLVCYVLVAATCAFGWAWDGPLGLVGMDPAHFGIAVATVAALSLLGLSAAQNFEKYRQCPTDDSARHDVSAFIALNALLLCALSTVALVWVAFPALILPTCSV